MELLAKSRGGGSLAFASMLFWLLSYAFISNPPWGIRVLFWVGAGLSLMVAIMAAIDFAKYQKLRRTLNRPS